MLCKKPISVNGNIIGCSQCTFCRINQKRKKAGRILMEDIANGPGIFATLTYDPENVPADYNLEPRDLTLFLKRLRKSIMPGTLRYFAAGEYGERDDRPHFHVLLWSTCTPEYLIDKIDKCWTYGFKDIAPVHSAGAGNYVSGYISKKSIKDATDYLVPEFSRQSKHPALGWDYIPLLGKSLLNGGWFTSEDLYTKTTKDVPFELKLNGTSYPLDDWFRNQLRLWIQNNSDHIPNPACNKTKSRIDQFIRNEKLKNSDSYRSLIAAARYQRAVEALGSHADPAELHQYAELIPASHIAERYIGGYDVYPELISEKFKQKIENSERRLNLYGLRTETL